MCMWMAFDAAASLNSKDFLWYWWYRSSSNVSIVLVSGRQPTKTFLQQQSYHQTKVLYENRCTFAALRAAFLIPSLLVVSQPVRACTAGSISGNIYFFFLSNPYPVLGGLPIHKIHHHLKQLLHLLGFVQLFQQDHAQEWLCLWHLVLQGFQLGQNASIYWSGTLGIQTRQYRLKQQSSF